MFLEGTRKASPKCDQCSCGGRSKAHRVHKYADSCDVQEANEPSGRPVQHGKNAANGLGAIRNNLHTARLQPVDRVVPRLVRVRDPERHFADASRLRPRRVRDARELCARGGGGARERHAHEGEVRDQRLGGARHQLRGRHGFQDARAEAPDPHPSGDGRGTRQVSPVARAARQEKHRRVLRLVHDGV